jgi:succinate-semialdehyde dehydrogenase/glutarate-semialdehyde dehydrogenase
MNLNTKWWRYQAGTWDQNNVNIGPIVNPTQHAEVLFHLENTRIKGTKSLLGEAHYELFSIQPTVITNITPDILLKQDETFSTVMAISRFKELSEAIERADSGPYSLAAIVFGGSGANTVAQQLEAGIVAIN